VLCPTCQWTSRFLAPFNGFLTNHFPNGTAKINPNSILNKPPFFF